MVALKYKLTHTEAKLEEAQMLQRMPYEHDPQIIRLDHENEEKSRRATS